MSAGLCVFRPVGIKYLFKYICNVKDTVTIKLQNETVKLYEISTFVETKDSSGLQKQHIRHWDLCMWISSRLLHDWMFAWTAVILSNIKREASRRQPADKYPEPR